MVPVGYLAGDRTVKEAMDDKDVGEYLKKALFEEIIPSLDMPRAELEGFASDVLERFENPYIKHELSAIALNSVSKYKVRVLPSLLKYYEKREELPKRLVFALAALIRFYQGEWEGEKTPLNDSDDVISFIQDAWKLNSYKKTADKVLGHAQFWDQDLTEIPGLTKLAAQYLESIDEHGVSKSLKELF
jgi:tagaturonate reductase